MPKAGFMSAHRTTLALKAVAIIFIAAAIAWNIYILIDAINFELGEHLTSTCRIFRSTLGIDLFSFAFFVQFAIWIVLILAYRSWLIAILGVFPFWVFFGSSICTTVS
jgi:hypothetical protein